MTCYALQNIEVNTSILKDSKYKHLFTVDTLNELVTRGIPFRDAYKIVAEQIEKGTYNAPEAISHTHEGSINNLCLDEIRQKMQAVL